MSAASWGLWLYLGAQRLWELSRARANERAMRAQGGVEHAAGHYPAMFAFHAVFFAVLAAALSRGARLGPRSGPWLALFAAAQLLRFWSVASLGPAWSTRIWTVPGRVPVRSGPYRFLRHPIYCAVIAEIAAVPMSFGLAGAAVALSVANAAILAVRVRAEDRALRAAC